MASESKIPEDRDKYITDIDILRRETLDESEKGWEGVKSLFRHMWNGQKYAEVSFLNIVFQYSASVGIFFGAILGYNSRQTMEDFQRKHNDSVFRGKFEAKTKLVNYTVKEVARHGAKLGWRVCLFSTSLAMLTTVSLIYRNRVLVLDSVANTALLGAFWKARLGTRAMFAAAIYGGILGLPLGLGLKFLLWINGMNVEQARLSLNRNILNYEYEVQERAIRDMAIILDNTRFATKETDLIVRNEELDRRRLAREIGPEFLTDKLVLEKK